MTLRVLAIAGFTTDENMSRWKIAAVTADGAAWQWYPRMDVSALEVDPWGTRKPEVYLPDVFAEPSPSSLYSHSRRVASGTREGILCVATDRWVGDGTSAEWFDFCDDSECASSAGRSGTAALLGRSRTLLNPSQESPNSFPEAILRLPHAVSEAIDAVLRCEATKLPPSSGHV